MRLLYLINAPGTRLSGAGRRMLALAVHERDAGADVCVGAPAGSGIHVAAQSAGVRSIELPFAATPRAIAALRRGVRECDPDIVHAMSFMPLTLAGLPTRSHAERPRTFVSIVVDPASPHPQARKHFRELVMRVRNAITRRDAERVDAIFAVSETVKTALERLGVRGRIVVGRNTLQVASLRERAQTPLDLPPGSPRIGTACAQVVAAKGVGYLIEAFATVLAHYPDACLVIAGEQDASLDVAAAARAAGVSGRVHTIGFLDDTAPFFAGLDLYVMPSLSEGINSSVLEAAVLGVPVVATNVGSLPEAVLADRTGLLVPPADSAALAAAMLALLDEPELAERLASAARDRAEREFDIERLYELTDAEYRRALSRAGIRA